MSEHEKYQVARRYVDTQIATMRENGSREISPEKYEQMVQKVAKAVLCK